MDCLDLVLGIVYRLGNVTDDISRFLDAFLELIFEIFETGRYYVLGETAEFVFDNFGHFGDDVV